MHAMRAAFVVDHSQIGSYTESAACLDAPLAEVNVLPVEKVVFVEPAGSRPKFYAEG